jgi:hypothetical protein
MSTQKKGHTMKELYLDNTDDVNAESHVETSTLAVPVSNVEETINSNQTLNVEKGVTSDIPDVGEKMVPNSPITEEDVDEDLLSTKVVKEVLQSLKNSIPESHVVPDFTTSLAQ